MRRLALYGSLVIVAHMGAVAWRLLLLSHIQPEVTIAQVKLFTALINLVPISALILLWTRFRRFGGLLLLAALGVGLVIGGSEHFLSIGPDNVFRMTPGEWTTPFQVSAVLLLVLEIGGCWIAIRVLLSQRSAQSRRSTPDLTVQSRH